MEAIDRYILVGLLEGSATQIQAFFRAYQVAGRDIPREQFHARRDILIERGDVAYNPGSEDRMHITERGRQTLYADLRKPVATTLPPQLMQEAARLIEIDGDEAFETVSRRFGESVALLLLVAHLRRGFGAMKAYPPDPEIEGKVLARLQELGLLG